ncbi:GNAT family N-acetyltransferase [Flaviaesturariibacter terrae]
MNIVNNTSNLRFETDQDGQLAYLEYRISGRQSLGDGALHDGKIMLMHTWVPEAIGGRGIAGALAQYAFDYAKAEGLPVVVYCPYVKVWLERHASYKNQVVTP